MDLLLSHQRAHNLRFPRLVSRKQERFPIESPFLHFRRRFQWLLLRFSECDMGKCNRSHGSFQLKLGDPNSCERYQFKIARSMWSHGRISSDFISFLTRAFRRNFNWISNLISYQISRSVEMAFAETSTALSSLMLPTKAPIWHPSDEVTEFDETVLNAEQWDLLELYRLNRSIHQPWYSIYLWAYISVITLTFVSNSLFFCSMIRRRDSWTPRNVFILNLAIADLCKFFLVYKFATVSFNPTIA